MAPETWFGALGILEFDDFYKLDRLFAHSKQTGSNLGNYMVTIWYEIVRETTFARTGKGIP
jgi:multisubunit Na+/H+ antiporter MnhG subunit